jgi:hypothetical protein
MDLQKQEENRQSGVSLFLSNAIIANEELLKHLSLAIPNVILNDDERKRFWNLFLSSYSYNKSHPQTRYNWGDGEQIFPIIKNQCGDVLDIAEKDDEIKHSLIMFLNSDLLWRIHKDFAANLFSDSRCQKWCHDHLLTSGIHPSFIFARDGIIDCIKKFPIPHEILENNVSKGNGKIEPPLWKLNTSIDVILALQDAGLDIEKTRHGNFPAKHNNQPVAPEIKDFFILRLSLAADKNSREKILDTIKKLHMFDSDVEILSAVLSKTIDKIPMENMLKPLKFYYPSISNKLPIIHLWSLLNSDNRTKKRSSDFIKAVGPLLNREINGSPLWMSLLIENISNSSVTDPLSLMTSASMYKTFKDQFAQFAFCVLDSYNSSGTSHSYSISPIKLKRIIDALVFAHQLDNQILSHINLFTKPTGNSFFDILAKQISDGSNIIENASRLVECMIPFNNDALLEISDNHKGMLLKIILERQMHAPLSHATRMAGQTLFKLTCAIDGIDNEAVCRLFSLTKNDDRGEIDRAFLLRDMNVSDSITSKKKSI